MTGLIFDPTYPHYDNYDAIEVSKTADIPLKHTWHSTRTTQVPLSFGTISVL